MRLLVLIFLLTQSLLLFAQNSAEQYISRYSQLAVKNMKSSGIPASITLAQGLLESGNGQSVLAKKANNHFGIKCGGNWNGKKVYMDDDAKGECFRKYRKVKHSFDDHSDFISKRDRYAFLFELDRKDYKGWAKGLKKAGYATNPNYPELLINLIERYELDRFDSRSKRRKVKKEEEKENNLAKDEGSSRFAKYCIVRKGDTLYSIAQRYKLSVDELKEINGISGESINKGQRLKVSR